MPYLSFSGMDGLALNASKNNLNWIPQKSVETSTSSNAVGYKFSRKSYIHTIPNPLSPEKLQPNTQIQLYEYTIIEICFGTLEHEINVWNLNFMENKRSKCESCFFFFFWKIIHPQEIAKNSKTLPFVQKFRCFPKNYCQIRSLPPHCIVGHYYVEAFILTILYSL